MAATQRILRYECFSGISGDMHLGAMVGLGVPEEHLRFELGKLGLSGWRLRLSPGSKMGIHGIRADVDLLPEPLVAPKGGDASGGAAARGSAARRAVRLAPVGAAGHEHRAYRDIKKLISDSALDAGVKDRALAIFARLAEAEAKIHDAPIEDVGFHEVGAVDSIVDIVGAAICLEYLKPDRISCSPVELGGGFVKCQHGLIPVPAPAVVELLKGVPVSSGAAAMETTTPTGAAILAASVDEFSRGLEFRITRAAYGVGHRDAEIPNLLRACLGERAVGAAPADGSAAPSAAPADDTAPAAAALPSLEAAVLVECNVDDMSPEIHGHLIDRLLESGAVDAWITPIVMKKSRAAAMLSALCSPEAEAAVSEVFYRETTSFGLRRREVSKRPLAREMKTVATSLGEVRVKTGYLGGMPIKSKLEYEDLRKIALERGMAFREVEAAVLRELGAK